MWLSTAYSTRPTTVTYYTGCGKIMLVNNASPKHISIIIPTHNRAGLLKQSLESISKLEIPAGIAVELLVIANACTDQTAEVCQAAAGTIPFPMRCVVEPQAGASHARNRALAEAGGEILAFLDDDIWVEPQWLAGLLDVFNQYPADLVGGKVTLWWKAVEKPAWMTHRSEHLLSSVDYGPEVRELFTGGDAISANLAVRRCVLNSVSGFRTDLDRQGRTLLAGGDTYFIQQAINAGHRLFYAPHAAIRHWVDIERITLPYLSRAAFANGMARIAMMDKLSPGKRVKLVCENGMKLLLYRLVEFLGVITGNQRGRINHRIRRMTALGVLTALSQSRG